MFLINHFQVIRRMIPGFALCAVLAFAAPASAQLVFTVNSAADASDSTPGDGVCAASGNVCTLRAAIEEANALSGVDTIQFAIGSGVQTINVGASLPPVTSPAIIDATTQPGFDGKPLIVLNGSGAGGSADGVTISGGGTTVKGLAITNFPGNGITLSGSGGNVLEANYFGMAADGVTAAGNSKNGVQIDGSLNNRIGGPSIAQRNLISGNTGKGAGGGIYVDGGGGNVIQGNFIGTDITGMLRRGNEGRGIAFSGSSNNVVGGPGAGLGNLISGNRATGVRFIGGAGNLVQANILGLNRTMTEFISNDRGVQLRSSNDNQVLGNLIMGHVYDGVLIWSGSTNNLVQANTIAFNGRGPVGDASESGWAGIWVADATRSHLLGNSIYGNARLGITVGLTWEATANDPLDADGGDNEMQNYPALGTVTAGASSTTVAGALNSKPDTSYLVQFFADSACDPTGYGEGRYPIGKATVTTNGSGHAPFSFTFPVVLAKGWIVSSTATDPAGSTSAFSACALVR